MTNKPKTYDRVRDYMKANPRPLRPTEIGMALGKSYTQASSFVTGALKKLLSEKLITKMDKGVYQWKGTGHES